MAKRITIRFATNWNRKLENDYFTTIRRNALDIKEGDIADVRVQDCGVEFEVKVIKIIQIKLDKITDLVSYLDIGMDKKGFIEYMQKAYKQDLKIGFLYLYLLKRMDRELPF